MIITLILLLYPVKIYELAALNPSKLSWQSIHLQMHVVKQYNQQNLMQVPTADIYMALFAQVIIGYVIV